MGGNTSKEAAELNKLKKEKTDREAAINRQRYYEAFEIQQDWHFVFGTEKPKKKKEVLVIDDITPRNVWFEKRYIFEKIKEHRPDELFHSIEHYALKWTPPGSQHQYMVPLDDPALQEMVIVRISSIPKKLQKQLLFFFAPRSLNMPMFAPKVHPASLVSYHLRSEVLQKLCSQYLEGRMDVVEFEAIVGSNYDLWKSAMFNMLPEDEQEFHKYLTFQAEVAVRTLKDIESDYVADKCSLQEFYDAKFPERKRKKDAEALNYPLPYPSGRCVICEDPEAGMIKCHVCDNKVCRQCVQTHYLDPETREGSFLLIHRRRCLKLPLLRPLHPVSVLEPAYLRELRATGQGHAMEVLGPLMYGKDAQEDEEEKEEEEDEEERAERLREEERIRREAEAEEQRKLKECPPELEHLKHALANRHKKVVKLQKEILHVQTNLDEPGHTEQYEARQERLKSELLAKLDESAGQPLQSILRAILALALTDSQTASSMVEETEQLIHRCSSMHEMGSVADFDGRLAEYAQQVEDKKNAYKAQQVREAHEAMAAAAKGAVGGGKKKKQQQQQQQQPEVAVAAVAAVAVEDRGPSDQETKS